VQPDKTAEVIFVKAVGAIFKWRAGRALEDELFDALPSDAVMKLLEYAVSLHGEDLVGEHIKSVSAGKLTLKDCRASITKDIRACLTKACATKSAAWFKNVTAMEHCGREIVGPALAKCDAEFRTIVDGVFAWIEDGRS